MTPTSQNHHLKDRDARHQGMTKGKRNSVPRDKTSEQKVLLERTKILLQPSSMAQMEWLLFWDQEIKIALL